MVAMVAGLSAVPDVASAGTGYVTTDLNLRSGPGTRYKRIAVIPSGHRVNIITCRGYGSWCYVGYRGHRGYASGRYIGAGGYRAPRRVYRQPRVIIAPQIYVGPRFRHRDYYYDRRYYRPHRVYRHRPHRVYRHHRPHRVERHHRPHRHYHHNRRHHSYGTVPGRRKQYQNPDGGSDR